MLLLWLLLAFAAGYATRHWVAPRVKARLAPPQPVVEDRLAGLRRYKEMKRGG